MGPNPAIKAWQTSGGKLIKVISGAASGGAELVVKKSITSAGAAQGPEAGHPLARQHPGRVAALLAQAHGLTTTPTGGGDVPITPITPNSDAVLAFESGSIAGGWEPAPYDAEMVADGGHVLVNEASLWPGGQFVTTNLVVTQSFLAGAPDRSITGLLKGQIEANSFIDQQQVRRRGRGQRRADQR